MNLTTLNIENFLGIDEVELDLDQVNFICGSNGRGKTSVRHGLEWLLSGTARMVKGSRLGEKNLIRDDGSDRCQVEAGLTDGVIRRSRSQNSPSTLYFSYRGVKQPDQRDDPSKTQIQESIYTKMDLNESVIHFLLDGEDYVDLKPDDRRSELFDLFGAATADEIESMLQETDLDEAQIEHAVEAMDDQETIDDLIDMYVEMRRQYKRDKKSAKNRADDNDEVGVVQFTVADEEREIPYKKALHIRDEKLKPKLKDVNNEITELQKTGLNFSLNDSADELTEKKKKLNEKLEQAPDHSKLEKKRNKVGAKLEQAKKRREMADSGEGNCIFDPDESCPVDEDTLENFSENIEEEIGDLEDKYEKIADKISTIDKLKNQKQKVEGRLESLPSPEQREKFKELTERSENLQTAIQEIDEAEKQNSAAREARETIKKKDEQIDRTNEIINTLKGIKGEMIPMDDYRDLLDSIGEIMDIDLKITSEGEITLNGRPPAFLSSSERIRLQYAHQLALCDLTEAGVIALDYAEELDKDNRKKLLKLLEEFRESYETLFVLIARQLNECPIDGNLINLDQKLS